MKRTIIGLILATALLLSCIPASMGLAEGMTYNGIDISTPVTLRLYSISDAPSDAALGDKFLAELNAKLKEKLNCTIEMTYAAGTNYQNNYQLALASGESYDLMHSASWLDYPTHAGKGAFMDISELAPTYAPTLWANIPQNRWNEVKVNGAIYGIPNQNNDPACQTCFMFREDLRKKYDLPEINSFETIAAYLKGIKDNEPELLPSDDYQSQVYGTMFIPSTPYQIVDTMGDMHSNFVIDPENPRKLLATTTTPEYLPFVKMMKDWCEQGFWPKSVLSSSDWGVFSVMNGKAASSFNGQFPGYSYHAVQLAEQNPGWEIDYFLFGDLNEKSVIHQNAATIGMISIGRNAKNPERALMLCDLLAGSDKELNRFINYGFEGINFNYSADGLIDTTGIAEEKRFNYFPGTLFYNPDFYVAPANRWYKHQDYLDKLAPRNTEDVLAGFALNVEPVQAQYTAINQIRIQYGYPIQVGLVEDVQAAYDDYVKRLQDAGLEEVRLEFERQINAFLDANGRA